MFDPTTIIVLSTLAGATGQLISGYQAKQEAKYNESVSLANAQALQQKAAFEEKMQRDRVRKLLSTQRALYGASGVEMSGSPLLVMEDTAAQGELDALAIRYGGDIQAAQARSQAALYKMQGRNAVRSGYMGAGSTLLTGLARYKKYKTSGEW